MAGIETYLEQIENAVFGKDVRRAIHDGIKQCYEDGKAGAIDLEARAEIRSLATLHEGSTTGDAELVAARAIRGTTYTNLSDALNAEFDKVNDELSEVSERRSKNIFNPSEAVQGTLNASGGVGESAFITTGMIPVSEGDVINFYYVQNDVFKHTGGILVVSLFDVNKNFISRTNTLYTPSYTVPSGGSFIRMTIAIRYNEYRNATMLTRNEEATSFESYVTPELTAVDFVARKMARDASVGVVVNEKIVDCWGDSRMDMIATSGTAVADYLLGLLGADYITANYGVSSQTANMVAARFGSNEVFVTLENNRIPASGRVNITAFKCSVGGRAGEDLRAQSIELPYGLKCEIAGVKGTLIRRYGTEQYFVRDEDGDTVTVKPRTKVLVPNYNSKAHINIFWAGKNDFGFNVSPRTQGIIDSIESMANSIGHDRFIILGETYSVNESYASGTTFRNAVNAINAHYASAYPDNYIDIQAELISRGLTLEGITPTAQDNENIANGFIPDSLMADTVHPNEKGREAVAKIIYSWMQDKEWVN